MIELAQALFPPVFPGLRLAAHVVSAGALLAAAVHFVNVCGPWLKAAGSVLAWLTRRRAPTDAPQEATELQGRIAEVRRRHAREVMLWTANAGVFMVVLLAITCEVTIASVTPRFLVMFVLVLAFYFSCLRAALSPQWLPSHSYIERWYWCFMTCLLFINSKAALSGTDGSDLIWCAGLRALARLGASLIRMEFKSSLMWNVLLSAVVVFRAACHPSLGLDTSVHSPMLQEHPVWHFFILECGQLGMLLAIAFQNEVWLIEKERAKMHVDRAREELAEEKVRSHDLLLSVFDATCQGRLESEVSGRPQIVVTSSSRELDELFGESMEGFDLLGEAHMSGDVDHLMKLFEPVSASPPSGAPLTSRTTVRKAIVEFRDASGLHFDVEVRSALGAHGANCVFLGIRVGGEKRRPTDVEQLRHIPAHAPSDLDPLDSISCLGQKDEVVVERLMWTALDSSSSASGSIASSSEHSSSPSRPCLEDSLRRRLCATPEGRTRQEGERRSPERLDD